MYSCNLCGKRFTEKTNLTRHKKTHANVQRFTCDECSKVFNRSDNLQIHKRKQHPVSQIPLPSGPLPAQTPTAISIPGTSTTTNTHKQVHTVRGMPPLPFLPPPPPPPSLPVKRKANDGSTHELGSKQGRQQWKVLRRKQALRNAIVSLSIKGEGRDPVAYLQGICSSVTDEVEDYLKPERGVKLSIVLVVSFFKPAPGDETVDEEVERYFWSDPSIILRGDTTVEKVESCFPKILCSIDEFIASGSGWVIKDIVNCEVHICRYKPLTGSSYKPLPKKIQNKHAVLNIKNSDQKCFLWSVIAHLHPVAVRDNPNRVHHYMRYEKEINCNGIEFPVDKRQIKKFESQNGLSISVYGWEDESLYPLFISEAPGEHIGLMLHDGHYSLVRSLDRLLSTQRGGHRQKWFCRKCLFPFYSEERRDEHVRICPNSTKIELSDKPTIKFENIHRMLRQPVVVYADFECILQPIETCQPSPDLSYTQAYQKHVPCGYAMLESRSCCGAPEFQEADVYRGGDCVKRFLDQLIEITTEHQEKIDSPAALNMSPDDDRRHLSSQCHICEKPIQYESDKVRDHCHLCGMYRGPAHNKCNQAFRLNRNITVVFHNLRRYDGHLIMQEVGAVAEQHGLGVSCVAKSMEDYLAFRLHNPAQDGDPGWTIKFIDSAQFLLASLDDLVKALPREKFIALSQGFTDIELFLRKGVYPYEYMDSTQKFDEKQLPSKDAFFSKLSGLGISDEDYHHAKLVWDCLNVKTLGQFHDIYVEADVRQLADVVEEFRVVCLKHYGLDPMHYITLPSFAWDSCLKITGVELQSVPDIDMYSFIEKGIRGGISVISHRRAKANNPLCPDFDPLLPNQWLMYIDANNLYGWAMNQLLPVGNLRWVEDLDSVDWATTTDGYIVEVDLDYPSELHEKHNDYPLAAEKLPVPQVSPYSKALKESLGLKDSLPKLIPNLLPKRNYIVHIKNLQQCLKLGLVLKKVHRALAFDQRAWMETYIMLNTRLRTGAATKFEKDLFKLMNNAVFGKTMENVRAYMEILLVTSEAELQKKVANPRFKQCVVFTEKLVGVLMAKKTVKLDKPIYVGFTVLDESKTLMFDFHYSHMMARYGDRAKLLFTDTDSFIYQIQTENVYHDMAEDSHLYDTADYPKEHPLYSTCNKKVIGKMKDELNGEPMWEFVGLRSKMYSFRTASGSEKKKAKGIKKAVVKREMAFCQYAEALEEQKVFKHRMNLIRPKKHQLQTVTINKSSLSPYDDKRYILDDGITTLAYGHVKIACI